MKGITFIKGYFANKYYRWAVLLIIIFLSLAGIFLLHAEIAQKKSAILKVQTTLSQMQQKISHNHLQVTGVKVAKPGAFIQSLAQKNNLALNNVVVNADHLQFAVKSVSVPRLLNFLTEVNSQGGIVVTQFGLISTGHENTVNASVTLGWKTKK